MRIFPPTSGLGPDLESAPDGADGLSVSLPGIESQEQLTYRQLAFGTVAVATLLRMAAVATLPLGNGEAYYATWARFPAWSYYDHPPLVAWMVWATTLLGRTASAVRLGPILCAAAFGLLFHRLAERFLRPRAALLALLLVTALPVFLISSFVLNPEAPLAPLWVASLLAIERLRDRQEPWRPLVAGALIGLAFLAKYTALLLLPATLLYLALSPQSRHWLRRPSLYLGALVALVVVLPVITWNQAHGWPSLQLHLLERNHAAAPVPGENPFNDLVGSAAGTGPGPGLASRTFRMLVGQAMSYSPLLTPLLLIGLCQLAWRARRSDEDRFLAIFSAATLLPLLALLVEIKDSEQHWTMMAMLPATLAAARAIDGGWERSRLWRGFVGLGFAASLGMFAVVNLHAHTTWLLRLLPADKYDPHVDIINELVGWDDVRESLRAAVAKTSGPVVLASTHYSLCGRLLFETDDSPPTYCPTARRSEFDFLDRRHPPAEATVLALTSGVHAALPEELAARQCTLIDTVAVKRGDLDVAHYELHSCAPLAPR